LFYNARYYDPNTAKFVSPDIIIPKIETPASLNRFSYVRNNPIKYNDPSGHCEGAEDGPDAKCWLYYKYAIGRLGFIPDGLAGWDESNLDNLLWWLDRGVSFVNGDKKWTSSEINVVRNALNMLNDLFGTAKTQRMLGLDRRQGLTFKRQTSDGGKRSAAGYNGVGQNKIDINTDDTVYLNSVLHELGHVVDAQYGRKLGYSSYWSEVKGGIWSQQTGWRYDSVEEWWYLDSSDERSRQGASEYAKDSPAEDFAETFLTYVLLATSGYTNDPALRRPGDSRIAALLVVINSF
jgi:hypothetical protein